VSTPRTPQHGERARRDGSQAATRRMAFAAVVGAVAVAAPLLLYFLAAPTLDDTWLALWVVAPIAGPLVFQLISHPRPEWGWGLAFAAVLALVFGVWGGADPPFEYSGAGQAALIGAYFFAVTFLAGMVGASVASLIGRLFDPRPGRGADQRRLRPWHVGVAIAAAEMLVVAVLAAVSI
jgi:hypothetical protein